MSGNALILGVNNDDLRYLKDKGFWILNTVMISIIWQIDFESFKKLITDNQTNIRNNQKIFGTTKIPIKWIGREDKAFNGDKDRL